MAYTKIHAVTATVNKAVTENWIILNQYPDRTPESPTIDKKTEKTYNPPKFDIK